MKIFILTEGGRGIGCGHIARCSALYDAFRKEGYSPRLIVSGDSTVSHLLKGRNIESFDWAKQKKRALEIISGADIAVVDSYRASPGFLKKISLSVSLPVFIDDTKRLSYPSGVVLNGSIGAERLGYPRKKGVSYLLGARYALLRKEFWKAGRLNNAKPLRSILVTVGGDDIRGVTPKILGQLKREFPDIWKKVVVGRSFRNIKQINGAKDSRTSLIYLPDAASMKRAMLGSDAAISAGGQTLYELARCGVPTIAFSVISNQATNIEGWKRAGFISFIGSYNSRDFNVNLKNALKRYLPYRERARRAKRGVQAVDGMGARNACRKLLAIAGSK